MAKGKSSMRIWTLYSILAVFVFLIGGFGFVVYQAKQTEAELRATQIASQQALTSVPESLSGSETKTEEPPSPESLYPDTKSMVIRNIPVQASIAETWPERIEGLSNTPYLPENTVKLFVFDSSGLHSFWMKDMNYSIDILWVDEAGVIVHIEEEASPASYPAMFVPNKEAKYVIETVAGFTKKYSITLGDSVVLPNL